MEQNVKTVGNEQSPFFRTLIARGIAREFNGSVANANARTPYRGNTFLIDARQGSMWTEQYLSQELNIETIASRLVDDKVRTEVVNFLKNQENYKNFIEELYPTVFIKFGDKVASAPKAVSVIQKLGLIDAAGYVMADMFLHVLAPTNTIEPTDPWFTSDVYLGTFPTYNALMTEVLKHELSSSLVGLPASVTGTVSGKITKEILAERMARQFEEVIIKLQGIGEYAIALQDVLLLIRSRVLPDVFMPKVIDSSKGQNRFDRDWLEDETIKQLSGNATLFMIAMENTAHNRIRTMPHRLDTWIARVSAFLTGGGRYKQVTVNDFRSRYTKRTVVNNFGVAKYCVLSQNVIPPAAAQVIEFLVGDKKSVGPVKFYEASEATSEMTQLFGSLPDKLASNHIVGLSHEALTEDALLNAETDTGIVHFAMDRYALGNRTTKLQTEYDRRMVELALAIGSFENCWVVERTAGSNQYDFMFRVETPMNPYQPVSGRRGLTETYLADPAEALMMAQDWVGSHNENTHVQVVPNKALRQPYINLEPLLFIDLGKEIKATIGYTGSIGGTKTFETTLLKLMGREKYASYHAIAPLMVNTQGNNLYSVLLAINEVAKVGSSEQVKQAASARLITEVTAIAKAMSTGFMESYAAQLRMDIAIQEPLQKQQAVLATMESKLYTTQIDIVLASLFTRRLGVFEQPNGKDDVMLEVLGKAAFFLKYEMPTA